MSSPAVQLGDWAQGGVQPTITPGVDDFEAIVPLFGPVSVGEPPVAPSIAKAVTVPWPVRSVGSRAGYTKTSGLATSQPARWTLGWPRLTSQERAAMETWCAATLRAGPAGSELAMSVRIDGVGAGLVNVRPLSGFSFVRLDGQGVHEVGSMEVEEVI